MQLKTILIRSVRGMSIYVEAHLGSLKWTFLGLREYCLLRDDGGDSDIKKY